MTSVDSVAVEPTPLEDYFKRVKSSQERFATVVTWHTVVIQDTQDEHLAPGTPDSQYVNVAQHHPHPDSQWKQGELNVDATLKSLAKVVKIARAHGYKVTKDYTSSDFNVVVMLDESKYLHITYYCPRDSVCEAKVVGTKVVPARPASPPEVVDVIEWECSKISLLGFDTDNDES